MYKKEVGLDDLQGHFQFQILNGSVLHTLALQLGFPRWLSEGSLSFCYMPISDQLDIVKD